MVTTQRALVQCLESLVQKIQIGVVVNFEKVISEGIDTSFKVGRRKSGNINFEMTTDFWTQEFSQIFHYQKSVVISKFILPDFQRTLQDSIHGADD